MKQLLFLLSFLSFGLALAQTECADAFTASLGTNTTTSAPYWFEFTATETNDFLISSLNMTTEDTYLEVYSDCNGTLIAENDDYLSTQSAVILALAQGQTIYIKWTDDYSSAGFDWSISQGPFAPGTFCEAPTQAVTGTNSLPSTNEEYFWYTYTMQETKKLVVSSSTSNYVTILTNDCEDLDDYDDGDGNASTTALKAGDEVLILWEANGGNFNWTLSEITLGPGDNCDLAVTATFGSNTTPSSPYWYKYSVVNGDYYTISSVGTTSDDTYLAVYSDCDSWANDDAPLGENDDFDSDNEVRQSQVTLDLNSGDDIFIYWENYDGPAGFDWNISLAPVLAGDKCEGAVAATLGTNSVPATVKNEYWYSYTMPGDGVIALGTEQFFILEYEIYTSCSNSTPEVTSDNSGNHFFSAGTDLFIKIGTKYPDNGIEGGQLDWILSFETRSARQVCQLAVPASLGSNTTIGAGDQFGSWYSFTMPSTGNLEITSDSNIGVGLSAACDGNSGYLDGGGAGYATEATLEEGDVVFIYWDTFFSIETINWNIAVTSFEVGDNCTQAITATSGMNTVPTTINSVLWYGYTMPQDGKITVSYLEETAIEVSTYDCSFSSDDLGRTIRLANNSQTILGLTQGDLVRIRLLPKGGGFDFDISVSNHDHGDVFEIPVLVEVGTNTIPPTRNFEYYTKFIMPQDGVLELYFENSDVDEVYIKNVNLTNGCGGNYEDSNGDCWEPVYHDIEEGMVTYQHPLWIADGDGYFKMAASMGDEIVIPWYIEGGQYEWWELEANPELEGLSVAFDFQIIISDPYPTPNVADLPEITSECPIESLEAPTATGLTSNTVVGVLDGEFPINETADIRWVYTDGDQVSSQIQHIVIEDITAPVPDLANLPDVTGECSVTELPTPSATDNCGGEVTVTNNANLPITSNTDVTWIYEDEDGNTSEQVQRVLIADTSGPTPDLEVLPDLTGQCEVIGFGIMTTPTATDNCGGEALVTSDAEFPYSGQGTYAITWTYTDDKGNTTTQIQNVIVEDTTPPMPELEVLPNLSQNCIYYDFTYPNATDNCGKPVTITHNADLPITRTTMFTWTFEDEVGNKAYRSQIAFVTDTQPPVPREGELDDVFADCSVDELTTPSAYELCGEITTTHNASLPITSTTVVTWTFEDIGGNTASFDQNIIINDVTAPIPDLAELPTINSQCAINSLESPNATDGCGGTVTVTNDASFPISGTALVTWTYTDGSGNSTTQTQNVVTDDLSAPVPDVATLPSINVQCSVISLDTPTATDNCNGTITGTTNVTLPITDTMVITWTYQDAKGNQVTQNQTVFVSDNIGPEPDLANLPDVTDACSVSSLTEPTATDNCGGPVTVTNNATFPITETTVVTWIYSDGLVTTSQTQNVLIVDDIPPTADDASLDDVTAICMLQSITPPTATDNCGGDVAVTINAIFPITASTTVTWTYEDGSGNTTTQDQNIVITEPDVPLEIAVKIMDEVSGSDGSADVTVTGGNGPYTYDWSDGSSAEDLTNVSGGEYSLTVTDANGCSLTISVTVRVMALAIDLETIDVRYYPNPSKDHLNIEATLETASNVHIQIMDITGKSVLSEKFKSTKLLTTQLNLSYLRSGVYLLRIDYGDKKYMERISIRH